MSDFKREERYIVVKLSDLDKSQMASLDSVLVFESIPTRECVVVESHWPIYEQTWDAVQRMAEGRVMREEELVQFIREVQDAWTQPWGSTAECVDRIFHVLERNSHLMPDREQQT